MALRYIIRDELNGAQALRFAQSLKGQSLAAHDTIKLSLRDASGVDVSGLAVLVRLHSQLKASGRRLELSDVPAHVEADFRELGLSNLIADAPRQRAVLPRFRLAPRRALA